MTKKLVLALIALVLIAASYHLSTLDGLPGLIFGRLLQEDTEYAQGYSEAEFRSVRSGMTDEEVQTFLGRPLGEQWMLKPGDPCISVYFEEDAVVHGCDRSGVMKGMGKVDASVRLGIPAEVSWFYSRSPRSTNYRVRIVRFIGGRTTDIASGFYLD